MYRLLQISVLFLTTLIFISCGSDSLAPDPVNNATEPVIAHYDGDAVQLDLSPNLHKTLAEVRRATAQYQDVTVAEESGYVQVSPFVPEMGYHYVNGSLLDAEVKPTEPEALVYVDNPVKDDARRLVAVEYVIPDPEEEMSHSDLDDRFSGVDGDKWHFDPHVGPGSWTLHAWVWHPNPEGVFHSTNPRVNPGQN